MNFGAGRKLHTDRQRLFHARDSDTALTVEIGDLGDCRSRAKPGQRDPETRGRRDGGWVGDAIEGLNPRPLADAVQIPRGEIPRVIARLNDINPIRGSDRSAQQRG